MTMFNVMEADCNISAKQYKKMHKSCHVSTAQVLNWQSYMKNSISVKKCGVHVIYVANILY